MARPRNAKGHFMKSNSMNAVEFQVAQAALITVDARETVVQAIKAAVIDFAASVYGRNTPKALLKAYRTLFDADYQVSYAWGKSNGIEV